MEDIIQGKIMIEYQILQGMVNDEDYTRQVMPFVKSEYFTQPDQKLIFRIISEYFEKYNALPVSYTHLTLPTICSV